MKFMVTGGVGFVGRQVVRVLTDRGVAVRLVVRTTSSGAVEDLPNIESIITTDDMFLESEQWWARNCAGIDTVIHAAWYTEPGEYFQSVKNLDCLIGTLNLARGASQAGVRRFVGIGTCFEYEFGDDVLTADAVLGPTTVYGASKAAAFMTLSRWLPVQSVEFLWCRLFYLFGEGEDERRLVPYLHKQLSEGKMAELTQGNQVRDFLDVAEAGKLIVDSVMSSEQGAVNICSGTPVTIRQLAERIATEHGRQDLLRFGARAENPVDPASIVGKPGGS